MKMAKAMALMAITLGCVAARAQEGPVVSVPGLDLQAGAAMNVQYNGPKDDLLAGTEKFAQGAVRVTEINLDPSTIGMMGTYYGQGGNMAKKMKLMVVHTYQYDKPGAYRTEDVEAYVKKLQDGSWSCPVVSREKDRFSYICAKADADHETNEMVILSAEPQQLTFIHMAGAVSFNDMSNMSGNTRGIERSVERGPSPDVMRLKVLPPMPPPPPAVPTPTPKAQQFQ